MAPPEQILPKNVRAMIQEHSAGGYILIKIDSDGDIIPIIEYDDEKTYQALMRKLGIFADSMKKVDDSMFMSQNFGPRIIMGSGMSEDDDDFFDDDDEEDGDYEGKFD